MHSIPNMEKIAKKIIDYLMNKGCSFAYEKECLIYAMDVALERIIGFVVLGILAVVLHKMVELFAFYVCFSFVRKRAGGWHAPSFLICLFISMMVCVGSSWLALYFSLHMCFFYVLCFIAVLILETIGAHNHPNIAWTEKEYKHTREKSRYNVIFVIMIAMILRVIFPNKEYDIYCLLALIVSAISMVVAIITRKEKTDERDKEYSAE